MKKMILLCLAIGMAMTAPAGVFETCVDDPGCHKQPDNGACIPGAEGACGGTVNYFVCSGKTMCENTFSIWCGGSSSTFTLTKFTGVCQGDPCAPLFDNGVLAYALPNDCDT